MMRSLGSAFLLMAGLPACVGSVGDRGPSPAVAHSSPATVEERSVLFEPLPAQPEHTGALIPEHTGADPYRYGVWFRTRDPLLRRATRLIDLTTARTADGIAITFFYAPFETLPSRLGQIRTQSAGKIESLLIFGTDPGPTAPPKIKGHVLKTWWRLGFSPGKHYLGVWTSAKTGHSIIGRFVDPATAPEAGEIVPMARTSLPVLGVSALPELHSSALALTLLVGPFSGDRYGLVTYSLRLS